MLAGPWGYSETEIAAAPLIHGPEARSVDPPNAPQADPSWVRLNLAYRVAGAAAIRA